MNALLTGNFSPSKSANKGYSATFLDWVVNAKEKGEKGGPCDIDISDDAIPVDQIWPVAQKSFQNL